MELGWDRDNFHRVDWWSFDFKLSKQSKMISIRLEKQASSFCGTRLMTSQIFNNDENCCPNCLLPNECFYHLKERTWQFHESIEQLEKWLDGRHTHPDIAFWVLRHRRSHNWVPFASRHHFAPLSAKLHMKPLMLTLAEDQDKIGWIYFMEGKSPNIFSAFNNHTWQVLIVWSMGETGLLDSSRRSWPSLTPNGSSRILPSMTGSKVSS